MTENDFSRIIEKYHRPVISLIYRHVYDWEASRDLAQDVFLTLWQRGIVSTRGRSVFTLIYRIAINKSIDHLRKNQTELLEKEPLSFYNADSVSEVNDIQTILIKCLRTLKIKQKSVYILSEIEGLSIDEIAKIMKTNRGNISSNLHLARKNIQLILKEHYQITEETFYEV